MFFNSDVDDVDVDDDDDDGETSIYDVLTLQCSVPSVIFSK